MKSVPVYPNLDNPATARNIMATLSVDVLYDTGGLQKVVTFDLNATKTKPTRLEIPMSEFSAYAEAFALLAKAHRDRMPFHEVELPAECTKTSRLLLYSARIERDADGQKLFCWQDNEHGYGEKYRRFPASDLKAVANLLMASVVPATRAACSIRLANE